MLGALQPIRLGLAGFLRWWGHELWGLVPEPLRRLVSGPGARIVVAVHPSGLHVLEERGRQVRSVGPGTTTVEPAGKTASTLVELARSKPRVPIGIRLPFDACFARRVELPAAARKDYPSILRLDLERATPFRVGDVYTSHYVENTIAESGKLKVRQLVVKRGTLDRVTADIESLGLRVSFADCWSDDGKTALPVNFLESHPSLRSPPRRPLRLTGLLVLAALLLACSAVFLVVQKHDSALEQLQNETVRAKAKAQNVRRILDQSEAAIAEVTSLRRMKLGSIPVVQILEELSRLLPDSAWLADLRIEGDTVEISGLAKSGAGLLPILERSAQFVDATLASPLTLDPREDRERVSVRFHIRRQSPARTTSDEGRSG